MAEQLEPINWGAVRVLAVAVGVREAARRMGIKEATVQKRSQREGWLSTPEARQVNKVVTAERRQQLSPLVANAGSVMLAELQQLGSETRLALAKGMAKAGRHVAELSGPEILENAQNVKSIAGTADLVHGWKDAAPQIKLRLDVLGSDAAAPVIDVEMDVSQTDDASYDVEDY